jgi:hypothetical protein
MKIILEARGDSVEAFGTKGMNNTNWRRTFKDWNAFAKWCEKNDGDVDILGVREIPVNERK